MYMKENHQGARPEIVEGDGLPIMVCKDSESKGILAYTVPNKGTCEYAVRKGTDDVNNVFGYKKVIFKSDQEPSLNVVLNSIQRNAGDQVIREKSPVGESKSNGEIENAVGRVQGMYRTVRSNLESNYGHKIESNHPALVWLVRFASLLMFWYERGPDGRTPYYRIKGREFNRKLANFGECIWYLKPKNTGGPMAYG